MVLRRRSSPSTRRFRLLKGLKLPRRPKKAQAHKDHGSCAGLTEVMKRNVALEAVRVGNYYAEDPHEVLRYIAEVHAGVLADQEWLRKNARKLRRDNGLTRRYTVQEILHKKHEEDGFDVFVDPDEAVLMAQRAEAKDAARPELTAGDAEEIQEGLDAVVASATAAPLSVEEVFELLERCVGGGEVAAAVYLAEHLEARHDRAPHLVEKLFQVLKSLLRPSAHAASPKLVGPWQKAPSGRYGALNPRKALGRLLERLAPLRRSSQDNSATRQLAEVKEALQKLSCSLLPALMADERAVHCRRRGQLVSILGSVAKQNGLALSPALAQAVFQHMESEGLLEVKGREVTLRLDQSVRTQESCPLQSLYTDLPLLEAHAKKKLERRKQRQQAREATKRRKRQKL